MFPLICYIGPLPVHSYGLMLALGLAAAAYLFARDARRLLIPSDISYDLVFWVVLCGILGARIFYIFLNIHFFIADPVEIFMLQKGGLAWQGSFIGGLSVGIIFIRRHGLPLWKVLDTAAPYIALGQSIGRIGCLLNGCCYGKAADWGLYFQVFEQRLIPTQVFMSLGQLMIFLVLRSVQPRLKRDGRLFVLYILLASAERFVVEFFRADHQLYAGLSVFQYICLALFAIALAVGSRIGKT